MTKSHVGMGYEMCPICTKKHNESILLDKQLRNKIEQENFLGWNLCDEHKAQRKDGYDFLVSIDETKSEQPYGLETVYRTGTIMAIKTHLYDQIFDKSPPTNGLSFCDDEVIEQLQNIIPKE